MRDGLDDETSTLAEIIKEAPWYRDQAQPREQPTSRRPDDQKPHMPWWQKAMVIAAIGTILIATVTILRFFSFFGISTFDTLLDLLPNWGYYQFDVALGIPACRCAVSCLDRS